MLRGNLNSLPRRLSRIRTYSSWAIPDNITKNNNHGGNVIRYKPSELIHPFYKIGPLEQFLLCFTEKNASLLNGKSNFVTWNKKKNQFIPTSLKVSCTNDIPEWVHNYSFHIYNNIFKDISSFHTLSETDISSSSRKSYITQENLPQIIPIINLLTRNKTSNVVFGPLNLVSLIDSATMTTESVFTEDVYTYILQNRCKSLNNITLTINAMIFHMDSLKLDQLSIVEKLTLQGIDTIKTSIDLSNTEHSNKAMEILNSLLVKIKEKFPDQILQAVTYFKLLDLYLMTGNLTKSHEYLHKLLMIHSTLPDQNLINSYLNLLRTSLPKDNTTKMAYISDLSSIIENQISLPILKFVVPLCADFSEIQRLVQILLKSGKSQSLINKESILLILTQIKKLETDNLLKGIQISTIYNSLKANKIDTDPYLKIFVSFFSKVHNYIMIAKIINSKKINLGENVIMVEEIIDNLKDNHQTTILSTMKKQFFSTYILPIANDMNLSEKAKNSIKDIQNTLII